MPATSTTWLVLFMTGPLTSRLSVRVNDIVLFQEFHTLVTK